MGHGNVKVLLLAGGLGTRLRPITETTPKCLVPIAGRPLLDYWFDRFEQAGVRDVRINTHHLPDPVRAYIDRTNRDGRFHVSETYESTLLGSAGTVTNNHDFADDADHMLIVYADNLSDIDLSQFLDEHRTHGKPFTMMLFRTPYPDKCGIAELDAGGTVVSFVEKPKQPKSTLANGGVYALTRDAYREIADMRKFDLGFDVIPAFVGRMHGWLWDGYHRDVGNLESLAQAEKDAPRVFGSAKAAVGVRT